MHTPKVLTARQAADLVKDGDTISVSASSGLGCPDAVLEGIAQRFDETSTPRGLTTIHPIAAGDMSGIKGIDHIAKPGLLRRVIAGSYPSGPSGAEPPAVWQMIESNELDAYNFPSGVLFQLQRAAASRQPGVFTKVGLDTFIDPRVSGGRMNDSTPPFGVEVAELRGEEWLFFDAIAPDVAVIRATTADEAGNLTYEEEASSLGCLDQAYAAHNTGGLVVAQVKRMVQRGSLDPREVHVPGILVDVIVVVPDQMQTTQTFYDPGISGQLRRLDSELPSIEFSLEKIMARRAASEVRSGEIVNLGFGVSALVPHILVEEGLGNSVSWVIEQGAVGGVPLLDFKFGVAQNPDAFMQSPDQFTLLQGGGFHRSMLSFLEVNPQGDVNVHHLPRRRHVTAGVGGFADIVSHAAEIVFVGSFTAGRRDIRAVDGGLDIISDGPYTKFVSSIAASTFVGRRALERGTRVIYVTERAVLRLTPEGLEVVEIAPGVDLERDVLGRCGFQLRVSDDLGLMDSRIFGPDPIGLRLPELAPHRRLR